VAKLRGTLVKSNKNGILVNFFAIDSVNELETVFDVAYMPLANC